MSIPNYLANIKSSGVYRFVFDKSQVPQVYRDSIRLVVGYSEKGPFNTPVYIDTVADFVATFGNISRRLERKGSFFHRSCIQALAAGPILALNLKPFNVDTANPEKADVYCFNAADIDGTIHKAPHKARVADGDVASIYNTNRFWVADPDALHDIDLDGATPEEQDYIRIAQTSSSEDSCTIFIRPYTPSQYNVRISDWYSSETGEDMPTYMESIKDHFLSEFFAEVYVFKGNLAQGSLFEETGTLGAYGKENGVDKWQKFCNVASGKVSLNDGFKNAYGEAADPLEAMSSVSTSGFIGRYQGILFPNFKDANGVLIDLASVFNAAYSKHKMLMHMNEAMLDDCVDGTAQVHGAAANATVLDLIHDLSSSTGSTPTDDGSQPLVYSPIGRSYDGIYMQGYEYKSITRATKGKDLVNACMGVLNYKGIREALTNNVDVDFKYIIDSFQGYPGKGMKSGFSELAKAKFNCLAITNFPPIKDLLVATTGKSFQGGASMSDLIKPISVPTEAQGASFMAMYTQLTYQDGSTKYTIPSAALVSNLFMTKRSERQAYQIVAGPRWGLIEYQGVTGPDYNYCRADLDVLEPMGVNALVYMPRTGVVINSNQTCKQVPVSALSKVHVRELVTYLQDELHAMLEGYHWMLNSSQVRAAIKAKADAILEQCKANGGIYEYGTKCDSQNNTQEVIDKEMLLLDVEIVPAAGAGKLVQTLSLMRPGTIEY